MNFSKQLRGGLKLILKGNILALTSERSLTAVSSAVYNGGFRKVKNILNVQVPEGYDERLLHENPKQYVLEAVNKLNLNPEETLGMITAANVKDFAMVTADEDDFSVTAVATAGCSHAEAAGEPIKVTRFNHLGTINIIVAINGNPTENCLMETFITATEAKAAGLRELDVRSAYSGDLATGTITDALTICSTGEEPKANFGGPASRLGRLVGYCTREAVKRAVMKQTNISFERSLLERLSERKVPLEKLVSEILKVNALNLDEKSVVRRVMEKVRNDRFIALLVLMAMKVDEDFARGLVPKELGDIKDLSCLSEKFRQITLNSSCKTKNSISIQNNSEYPFLTQILAGIIENGF